MDHVYNFWLGVIAISTIGTLAHFFYDWSNHNKIIGLFAAVNESVWEHVKIALTPTFLWALYDGFIYGSEPNYFLAKFANILILVLLIPAFFYLSTTIFKKSIVIINIGIFYVSIIFSQLIFYLLIMLIAQPFIVNFIACIGLFILFGCYMTLTLSPIRNSIFRDPITNRYGFKAHSDPAKTKNKK